MKKFSCIDLFCGAGGFSLGLSRNNIEIVLANEIEKDFAKTFELNHPKTKMLNRDIHNVDFKNELKGVRRIFPHFFELLRLSFFCFD